MTSKELVSIGEQLHRLQRVENDIQRTMDDLKKMIESAKCPTCGVENKLVFTYGSLNENSRGMLLTCANCKMRFLAIPDEKK
ncbi:MAG: hypothetical protein Q8K86_08245 [Candidatus Nanopelagicaceae bacterium]|nr:hypothetical protein [Candidatus Nanopelagicaceae bacterium]